MKSSYLKFIAELFVEGVIMYFVMYAMVDVADHVYHNNNNFYMAAMMTAPMGVIMLMFMGHMFPYKAANVALMAVFLLAFVASFYAIRQQKGVDDAQLLRAMIPHHSGAILMCRKANITDPEIISLCQKITESQQREIDQMEAILKRR